jgi:hypothetical protein
MFDFVRTHSRLMLGLMVLLIFPSFVFFGIQGYSRFTDGARPMRPRSTAGHHPCRVGRRRTSARSTHAPADARRGRAAVRHPRTESARRWTA